MASAYKLPIHPHTSMTGLNMAATIHFLCAIDNGGNFEGDVSKGNRFRDELCDRKPYEVGKDGCVHRHPRVDEGQADVRQTGASGGGIETNVFI